MESKTDDRDGGGGGDDDGGTTSPPLVQETVAMKDNTTTTMNAQEMKISQAVVIIESKVEIKEIIASSGDSEEVVTKDKKSEEDIIEENTVSAGGIKVTESENLMNNHENETKKDVEGNRIEEDGGKNEIKISEKLIESENINEVDEISESEDMEKSETTEAVSGDPGQNQNGPLVEIMTRKRAASLTTNEGPLAKLGRNNTPSSSSSVSSVESSPKGVLDDGEHDPYCWACHKLDVQIHCRICQRSYHSKCMQHDSPETKTEDGSSCVCPECVVVMKAENVNHRSDAMQLLSMDQLSSMLKYICGRMKVTQGAEPFLKPVSPEDAEDYYEYVKFPVDIAKLETNIKNRQYGSTEAFLADAQWIVHNSIIFNSVSSPYTAAAKRLLKVCRQELSEIETCPECYTNAHTKENWFIEACKRPHILVWAKLKGFPYWPAKAMKVKDDQVDVRFFGQHDRAWVSVKDCYLYSLEQPNAAPKKSSPLIAAIDELNQHIEKLKKAFEEVTLAEGKVVMDSTLGVEQIQRMLPKYIPQEPSQLRSSTQVNPKLVPSPGKSPVVMTISSLKTSPTVVSNSAVTEVESDSGSSDEELTQENTPGNPDEGSTDGESVQAELTKEKTEEVIKKEGKTETPTTKVEVTDRRRPPSGILASALGLRRVVKRQLPVDEKNESSESTTLAPTRKSLRRLSSASTDVKMEMEKSEDSAEEQKLEGQTNKIKSESQQKTKQSKAQDLMDQISSQAQTKPGYRFNISKDISISAIGGDGDVSNPPKVQNNSGNKVVRRIAVVETGGRLVRPPMSRKPGVQTMQLQIQQMTQGNKPSLNQGQSPRFVQMNKNPTGIRPIRPNTISNPKGVQGSMVRPSVPPVKNEVAQVPTSSVAATLQVTPAQTISGAITLPGGTITVTPLTPIIAGIPVSPASIPSYSTTTTTVNLNGAVNGLPALVPAKSGQPTAAVVRRTGTVTLPNTVASHMQNCSKGIQELLKSTVELIAFDILDGGSISGKIDVAVAQKEKEALIVKHAKEMNDLRHCHEIAMRELRVSLENEKRRAVVEAKRQIEQEKNRAVEEAKKKQWCARCQREAQFYCCWNTSYCGYHCQEQHWPQHMNICNQNKAQAAAQESISASPTTVEN